MPGLEELGVMDTIVGAEAELSDSTYWVVTVEVDELVLIDILVGPMLDEQAEGRVKTTCMLVTETILA